MSKLMTPDGPPRGYPGVCPNCNVRLQTQYWSQNDGTGASNLHNSPSGGSGVMKITCPECGYNKASQNAVDI